MLVKVCSLIRPQAFVHTVMNILFPQRARNIFSRRQYIASFYTATQTIARRPSITEILGPSVGQFVLAHQVAKGQVPPPSSTSVLPFQNHFTNYRP